METNLKKLLAIVGVACLSITSVFAQDAMNQNQRMNGNGDDVGVCPSRCAVPCGKYCPGDCGPVIFVSAAYTLWTAREAGLAIADSNFYFPPVADGAQGRTAYPQWRLRSGFKVDVGVFLDHDCWDGKVEYTWFYNKNNKMKTFNSSSSCAGSVSYSTWPVSMCPCPEDATTDTILTDLTTVVLDSASSKWNIWVNRIDGQLGRTFYTGHYTTLRPFIGLLGAWDNQDFDFNYTANNGDQFEWRNNQKWWGVGPYAGFDPSFTFAPGDQCNMWSVFVDSGMALLWGRFNAHHNLYDVVATGSTECDPTQLITEMSYEDIFWNITPMVELSLGLRWETWMESGWYFLLQAAWETQCYFEHNHFHAAGYPTNGCGNLTLQGFTLKARVGF